jgi:acyl-CoA synthetase (AMP-forming)/AMP-acid ligase II
MTVHESDMTLRMTSSWIAWLQVAPAELEAHLLGHEQVADACVVQKNCDRAGELPKAYVVPKDAAAADKEKIRADVNAHVWGETIMERGISYWSWRCANEDECRLHKKTAGL